MIAALVTGKTKRSVIACACVAAGCMHRHGRIKALVISKQPLLENKRRSVIAACMKASKKRSLIATVTLLASKKRSLIASVTHLASKKRSLIASVWHLASKKLSL